MILKQLVKISLVFLSFFPLLAREIGPTMKNISRFEEDHIIFHHYHGLDEQGKKIAGIDPNLDPSNSSLVVVKDSQTFIFRDGYDDKSEVSSRINDYQKKVALYRSRRAFLKEFRDIIDERSKISKVSENFKNKKDNSKLYLHSLYSKYDSVYKTIDLEKKKSIAEEYRQKRFAGENSPSHIQSKQRLDELINEQDGRAQFLESTLTKEMNANPEPIVTSNSDVMKPDAKNTTPLKTTESSNNGNTDNIIPDLSSKRIQTPLTKADNPGEWNDMNFFTNNIDGTIDYFSYSRTARTIDIEKKDIGDKKTVSEKYGNVFNTMVDRLLQSHITKLKYMYSRKNETGSKSLIEDHPLGKGKRLILVTNDNTRYVLEDWDGDGKTETFEVSNLSYPIKYASDSANIISIANCKSSKYCGLFENLLNDLETGTGTDISSIQSYGKNNTILGTEDELLRDWDELIKK
jgi:hypothetical protein